MNNNLTVGSIFRCSWGYEQTNVDYYQVTAINPSGKTITVRMIDAKVTNNGAMCGTSKAIKDAFIGAPMNKRLYSSGTTFAFNVNSFSNAYLMDDINKESYVSWYH